MFRMFITVVLYAFFFLHKVHKMKVQWWSCMSIRMFRFLR